MQDERNLTIELNDTKLKEDEKKEIKRECKNQK